MATVDKFNKNVIAQEVLMIEPVAFGFNRQTATNNYFQHELLGEDVDIQKNALMEYENMVQKLRANGICVISVKDSAQTPSPDSIFPNNWISFHENGQVVIYPMFAPNRRLERRLDILDLIEQSGKILNNVDDFSFGEDENHFLEGTGSMVFDRKNRIAYAALSERTDKSLLLQFCKTFGFHPVYFSAFQQVDNERLPIYHTNVMMCVADRYVVVCLQCIDNDKEKHELVASFNRSGKEIIEITGQQMSCFAGNMLQVQNVDGKLFLVMSESAFSSFSEAQIKKLRSFNQLIVCDIPTIERVGGGSVRCMMAEVF